MKLEIEDLRDNIDEIADSVERIADISEQILNGRLNENAVIILLQAKTRLPQSTIKTVLRALPELRTYLKPKNREV